MNLEIQNLGKKYAEIQAQNLIILSGSTSNELIVSTRQDASEFQKQISNYLSIYPSQISFVETEMIRNLLLVQPLASA